ncbi:MAG TPA: PEP-CTERM sorting domain-containing protein [Bryobacteraceae bacterium]
MKIHLPLCSCLLLLTPLIAQADSLIVGTPGDALLATPSGPSPNFGGTLLTFSNLTPFSTFNPSTYASEGITISSPDGLLVLPYSTQTNPPNELFDNSSNGTANFTISLASGTTGIGVGIADSDSLVNIVLQALGAGGVDLGSAFAVTIPETTVNPGNGYFVVEDTTADIRGLQITQTIGSSNYSGLAIADVQVAPEPSSWVLLAGGLAMIGFYRLLKRA